MQVSNIGFKRSSCLTRVRKSNITNNANFQFILLAEFCKALKIKLSCKLPYSLKTFYNLPKMCRFLSSHHKSNAKFNKSKNFNSNAKWSITYNVNFFSSFYFWIRQCFIILYKKKKKTSYCVLKLCKIVMDALKSTLWIGLKIFWQQKMGNFGSKKKKNCRSRLYWPEDGFRGHKFSFHSIYNRYWFWPIIVCQKKTLPGQDSQGYTPYMFRVRNTKPSVTSK